MPGLGSNPPVTMRSYRPVDLSGPLPCLYWIHGGAHMLGSIDQDDLLAEQYVRAGDCMIVLVDWRLSPEDPYPALMDDCYAGLSWTFAHADELGIDPERIAVGGGSSGGGAAAGLALLARDRGEIPVCFQLLLYAMLDDREHSPSSQTINECRNWNREFTRIAWEAYLRRVTSANEEVPIYAAPGRAGDLSGLPPAYIATGDLDLLLDENLVYAQRLIQAGVPTELHVYPGAYHTFELLVPVSTSPPCRLALSNSARSRHRQWRFSEGGRQCAPRHVFLRPFHRSR
ncbi:MAG: alpha/beta hydrolase [Chloroflexi bacterium]|nr:alpha/beta hydrolase [Chloroflexota bacterium]